MDARACSSSTRNDSWSRISVETEKLSTPVIEHGNSNIVVRTVPHSIFCVQLAKDILLIKINFSLQPGFLTSEVSN